jgi:ACS family pantothenate transporter-like MFS transporter
VLTTCLDTFSAWIPLVWFQQVQQPNVTAGNKGAAVVAGLNVIVFIIIALLAHREKVEKKRKRLLEPSPALSVTDSSAQSIEDGGEKKVERIEVSEVGKL